MFFASALVPVC